MITNFCEQLWVDFDLEIEFFLRHLVGWIRYNAAKDNPEHRNFKDGQYWSYNSYNEFSKLFPGFTTKTMRTIIARCIKHGLLISGNFNKKKYDNTNWYTLTQKGWEYFPLEASKLYPPVNSDKDESDLNTIARSGIPPAQTGRPIPKNINSLSNINITNSKSSSKQRAEQLMSELIEVYRQEFPNNPQPHPRVLSTSLKKTLSSLIQRWRELDPGGNSLTEEVFRRYLVALKTLAPKFSLGEYVTENGTKKKNNLETFARWNTVVKFLENQYS